MGNTLPVRFYSLTEEEPEDPAACELVDEPGDHDGQPEQQVRRGQRRDEDVRRPLQRCKGCTQRLFPGCVNSDEKVASCLSTAGRKTQFFHPIFTQPRKHSLEVPCMLV